MKNTLKNLAIFLAGGATFMYTYVKGLEANTKYPREGSVLYEDDNMKVIRMSKEKPKNIDLATVVYKNHKENGEP